MSPYHGLGSLRFDVILLRWFPQLLSHADRNYETTFVQDRYYVKDDPARSDL